MPPGLTVALPTYNGARHLAEALRSILAQKEDSFELLICDDRSDDDTLSVVTREAGDRARIEINSERLGLAGNWNRCVSLTRSPLVAIFHQDDLMRPGHLAAHRSTFDRHPGLGMVCGAAEVVDDQGRSVPPSIVERPDLGPSDRLFEPGAFVAELSYRNPVRCSAVTLSQSAHADVGGFDPSYRYAVDWEFWLRLARRWPVAWLARPSVAVRWHPGSETHRFKLGTADLDEVRRLLDHLHTTDTALLPDPSRARSLSHRRLSRAYLNRSHDALRAGDPIVARRCLRLAVSIHPPILGTVARDPRLTAELTALLLVPRWTARRLARPVPGPCDDSSPHRPDTNFL